MKQQQRALVNRLQEEADLNRTTHLLRLVTQQCFPVCVKSAGMQLTEAQKDCLVHCSNTLTLTHSFISDILNQE
jgi:hypothetical protein